MIKFWFNANIDAIVFEVRGEFTADEYFDAMERFLSSEHFRPGVDTLWDFRKSSQTSVTTADLRKIAEYNEEIAPWRGPTWKAAIVVTSEVGFGLSRMFEAYADAAPNQVRVFRDIQQAEDWIAGE